MAVSLHYERQWWSRGAATVVGIDEVGRGALAGPVSVGAVAVAACDTWPAGLADSKELNASQRESLVDALSDFGVARAVGHAWPAEIDAVGMTAALRLAAWRAIDLLNVEVHALIVDGHHDYVTAAPDLFAASAGDPPAPQVPVTTVVKGDGLCASVAAASVVAKVERDQWMVEQAASWPHYGWERNKGYGSPDHLEALRRHGASPHHRVSWNIPGTPDKRA